MAIDGVINLDVVMTAARVVVEFRNLSLLKT